MNGISCCCGKPQPLLWGFPVFTDFIEGNIVLIDNGINERICKVIGGHRAAPSPMVVGMAGLG